MKKYYIDFSGYCIIEAEDEEEARMKFWDIAISDNALPSNVYEIEGIEEGDF